MGYLLSSFLWMYVLCLIPVGLLVDRFGGKAVNAAGIGIWSAATVLTGFTTGFASMAATRIVMGMGESTSWPACNRVIREWFPASERGFANAVFGAGAAAGPAIGAVLVSAIVAWLGWRAGFFVAGASGSSGSAPGCWRSTSPSASVAARTPNATGSWPSAMARQGRPPCIRPRRSGIC